MTDPIFNSYEVPRLGCIVRIDGDLYELTSVVNDAPTVFFTKVNAAVCRECAQPIQRSYRVGSLIYRNEVQSVDTVST